MLDIEASSVAQPLQEAVDVLHSDGTARSTGFLRPNSKGIRRRRAQADPRLWETAVLFHCATCGWRGRAATAISGRCCRFPPSPMRPQSTGPGRPARLARRAPVRGGASTSACAKRPRPRPRTASGELMRIPRWLTEAQPAFFLDCRRPLSPAFAGLARAGRCSAPVAASSKSSFGALATAAATRGAFRNVRSS